MSLKQSVLSLFYFRIPRMSRPILTSLSEEPVDEASSSDKDVSDATLSARTTFSIVIFLAGSVRRDKREIFYQSKADTAPPCSHGPVRLPRNRKVGPRARASWVGV
uniref:hypothetical protein n=1 Tax=Jatropha curcas TaxID=180498 RepID=UPI0027A708A5|nr:hypothetical protein QLP06_mgp012 [Jatropha curcas]WFG81227.1 hypothetical protein [Jatropha curcas]